MTTAEIDRAPGRRAILLLSATAALAALVILLVAILPAEYGRDPTGLGRAIGTATLSAPAGTVVSAPAPAAQDSRSYPVAFRSDVIAVPLKASGDPERGDEVEYKVEVQKGGSYVYSWKVAGVANPEEFYTEFHGHTVQSGAAMTVAYYRKATGTYDNGVLTAPFTGVHGWYFQNQSERPATVTLHIAGFYDLIPAGKAGNEAGLRARRVQ